MGAWVWLTTVNVRERPHTANGFAPGEFHWPRPLTKQGMTARCRWGISAHFAASAQMQTMTSSSMSDLSKVFLVIVLMSIAR